MTIKDNGDWLSAEQAVRPDGTEVQHLSLINKKLPPLSTTQACAQANTPMATLNSELSSNDTQTEPK
jgi:hypothetical protein